MNSGHSILNERFIRELQKVGDAAPLPKDEALFRYLEAAYTFRRQWDPRSRKNETLWRNAHDNLHPRLKKLAVRVIIELTAPQHITPRMRWKYAAALQCALEHRVRRGQLAKFIEQHGGLNGTIKKFYQSMPEHN